MVSRFCLSLIKSKATTRFSRELGLFKAASKPIFEGLRGCSFAVNTRMTDLDVQKALSRENELGNKLKHEVRFAEGEISTSNLR